jgi:caspase domain-containing protein
VRNRLAASRVYPVLLLFALLALTPPRASADMRVQRFTLVIGANFGGAERPRLQYAVADAERFARVLVELGGVSPANEIVLRQPKLRDLTDGLDRLAARVAEARRSAGSDGGGRTEVLLYYSGHADEQGLLLGDDRYSYRTLRDRLDQIPADVRIAVLDACASGAFTRIKSGRARPAFLVDQASNMRGHAFLTSSAATEAAQESDRIRASYFTHYLVSGFRGAADLSGDGKVTLNEAYQFAFNETLGRTVDTRGGPQHPSYDISLSGTGDVVMTDIRQTTATIVLGEDLDGRFFVRNAANELIVELYKPRGRSVELGVEPGTYEVRLEIQKASLSARTDVADGARVVLASRQFGPVAVEATRRRGGPDVGRLAVDGRNRLSLRFGMWRTPGSAVQVSAGVGDPDLFGGVEYTRYIREDLSVAVGVQNLGVVTGSSVGPGGVFSGVADVTAMPIVVRWNPLQKKLAQQAVKPFVAFGLGPVFGDSSGSFVGGGTVLTGVHTQATAGGHVGAGVDFHLARSFAVGVSGGYNWMMDFSRPVGPRDNYSGPEFGVSLGWLFGRGRSASTTRPSRR